MCHTEAGREQNPKLAEQIPEIRQLLLTPSDRNSKLITILANQLSQIATCDRYSHNVNCEIVTDHLLKHGQLDRH
jgi:hypothetical protein